jgi:glycosyltransferase involved in cell wall biosynthesis
VTGRVAIVQEAVFHYRERFYVLLRERLAEDDIELVLIHSNALPGRDVWRSTVELPWAHRVDARTLRVAGRRLVWQRGHRLLRGCDLVIVEQGSRHLLNYVLLVEQMLGRRRVALWGHGRNFDEEDASRLGEALKARWSARVHWWFVYNDLSASVVAGLGVPSQRITVVQNAVDTAQLRALVDSLHDADHERTRRDLGLTGQPTGLYVGGLAPEKRLSYLFEAADAIREQLPGFELIIAGAGTERTTVVAQADQRPWVHVVGPVRDEAKAALFGVADVFLMPAWAGLAVLDSFAAGVPMAVSGTLPHPPEASYLEDGRNGLVIDDGGDPQRYADAVTALLRDRVRYQALRVGCQRAADTYTVEAMVERFATGVLGALA